MCQLLHKGEDHDFEYRFLHADGHSIWVRDIVSVEMKESIPRC
ncbi:PAS domain-containing protein [Candidatus Reidiella endopervernicosa]|uniref:PAS domain-containing protein n=1 Tax=Candidatus Reidiella endopervernicosa TaxID=2738883 RepID=A0A6N0HYC2_9GAMM|nr:PAS domain-containing protein [Candidatus Reidiella endopervernicosa]